jgi:hypothetical protein
LAGDPAPLYAGWALFNIFIEQDAPPSEIGGGTIWFGLSFGVLLLALNLLVFYLYVKPVREAFGRLRSQGLCRGTGEHAAGLDRGRGLSGAFIRSGV